MIQKNREICILLKTSHKIKFIECITSDLKKACWKKQLLFK